MKTIVDFLKTNGYENDKIYEVGDASFAMNGDMVVVSYNGESWGVPASRQDVDLQVQDILETYYEVEMRFCNECGRPYDAGFVAGDGDYYCCEDCFEPMMNRDYGEGNWKITEEEGYRGGFYAYLDKNGKWEDTGFFYTEWY